MSCDKSHIPNEETVKAMEEADKNLSGQFDTVEELFADLEKD